MKVSHLFGAGVLLLGIGQQALSQPEPWSHPDGSIHYYWTLADPGGIAWAAAEDSAEKFGGYLATLTSQAENDFVHSLVSSWSYWHKRSSPRVWAGPWLGGRQRAGAPEPDSGWEWITGESFDYSNWSSGQPNNYGGQDAIHFGESPYCWLSTWNDVSSLDTVIRGYVVEFSAESTTVGLLQNDSSACDGYTLFQSTRSPGIYLIDSEGRCVHSWHSQYLPALSNYLLPDGNLLHTARVGNTHFPGGWAGGRVELLDWESNLLWAYDYSTDDYCQHHDVAPLPNGNVLLLAWEVKTRDEAIAAGRDPDKLWSGELWPGHIIEVDPLSDSIVWQWHVWDHLIQDFDSTKANYGVVAEHSELADINYTPTGTAYADWMHSNTLDYNPQFDQVILDVRDLGEFWVIDHSTTTQEAQGHSGGRYDMGGDILYRWGNPEAYRAGGAADRKFFGQHETRWVEPGLPGAGHITLFNNGVGRPGGKYSTVDEFIPACDSNGNYPRPESGQPFGPSELCWSYASTSPKQFYSRYMSGARRLPNGNTLICEADSGFFFEVTHDLQVVWRYVNPVTDTTRLCQGDTVPKASWGRQNSTFRATRYAPDYPGLVGRDLTPGCPLERYAHPPLGVAEKKPLPARPRLTISPNPFRGMVTIALEHVAARPQDRVAAGIFDASGRLVRTLSAASSLAPSPLSLSWDGRDGSGRRCPPGVYVCRVKALGTTATAKLLLAE
jgi:hypothetical protein